LSGTGGAAAYPRFSLARRVEHALLILSFVTLAATGLPQKYASVPLGEQLIGLLGGIEVVRIVHRVAAVLLMLQTIYHLVDVAYRVLVLRVGLSMLPRATDVAHAWQAVRYNLGLASERPRMGRYTFEEKVEYWALVWGTVIMVATGFMLWNPVATARFVPGQFIPAAQAAHGGEALLAVLAVIIWHGYAVHLRHFNRSMWTGVLSEEEMREHHALELEQIRAGASLPAPEPALLARRRWFFFPVAGLLCSLLLAGVYLFVTFEQTAITTLPPTKQLK
jgi:formate dehydrogenase gamma subunit